MRTESTKTTSQTLFLMVLQPEDSVKRRRSARGRVEGVFAWCRGRPAPSFPSSAADCSPEPIPDRGAELNLFIACTPSRAWRTAAEHKRISRALSALHHLRYRHAATALSCVAANMLHCFTPLPPVLNIEERPASSQGLSARRISHWRSPHNHCLL